MWMLSYRLTVRIECFFDCSHSLFVQVLLSAVQAAQLELQYRLCVFFTIWHNLAQTPKAEICTAPGSKALTDDEAFLARNPRYARSVGKNDHCDDCPIFDVTFS